MIDGIHVVDTDSHVYEPAEVWDRVPAARRDAARRAFLHVTDDLGQPNVVLNGSPAPAMHEGALVRQAVWRPGTTADDVGDLDPHTVAPLNPGAWRLEERLADMDAMGIDEAVVYPTLFNEYLPLVEDRAAAADLAAAYNDWLADLCAASSGRLLPVAVLPLQSIDHAVAELRRVAGLGFRAAVVRPMLYGIPVDERPPKRTEDPMAAFFGDPQRIFVDHDYYAPLWDLLDEAGVVACIHPSTASTNPDGVSAGTFAERVAARLGIGHRVAETVAGIQDIAVFITAACYHGLFEDHPTLRFAFAHGSASMTPLTLEKSETYLWLSLTARGPQPTIPTPVSLEPEDVFAEHPAIVSFPSWESSIGRLADKVRTVGEKAAWSSRYPHHDAADARDALAMLRSAGLGDEPIRRLLGGNASELFGLTAPAGVT